MTSSYDITLYHVVVYWYTPIVHSLSRFLGRKQRRALKENRFESSDCLIFVITITNMISYVISCFYSFYLHWCIRYSLFVHVSTVIIFIGKLYIICVKKLYYEKFSVISISGKSNRQKTLKQMKFEMNKKKSSRRIAFFENLNKKKATVDRHRLHFFTYRRRNAATVVSAAFTRDLVHLRIFSSRIVHVFFFFWKIVVLNVRCSTKSNQLTSLNSSFRGSAKYFA